MFDPKGAAGGVSGASFGWLDSANGPDEAARAARLQALAAWRVPPFGSLVTWCGALRDRGGAGAQEVEVPAGLSLSGPVWFHPEDGVIDVAAAVHALLDHSAITLRREAVRRVAPRQIWVDDGAVTVASIVVAAGLGSLKFYPDLPIGPGPVAFVDYGHIAPSFDQVICGWGCELRQRQDGRVIGTAAADASPGALRAAAEAVLKRSLPVPTVTVADRPMTKDARPVVSEVAPGVIAAIGHPGVILAPQMAARVAALIGAPV